MITTKKLCIRILLFAGIASFIMGCQLGNTSERIEQDQAFLDLFETLSMNDHIQLNFPEVFGNPPANSVPLALFNNSGETIRISKSDDVKMLAYSDEKEWYEIKNNVNYHGDTHVTLTPSGSLRHATSVNVYPDVPAEERPMQIRVVVIGTIMRDGQLTDEKVGAYLDITLE